MNDHQLHAAREMIDGIYALIALGVLQTIFLCLIWVRLP